MPVKKSSSKTKAGRLASTVAPPPVAPSPVALPADLSTNGHSSDAGTPLLVLEPATVMPAAVVPAAGVADPATAEPREAPEEPLPATATKGANAARDLPEEVLAFLVRSAPPREVWKWLGQDDRWPLQQAVTRGFQCTVNVLRQTIVRSRLTHHLGTDNDAFRELLSIWGDSAPIPPVVAEVRGYEDEAALDAELPTLWRRYGSEALLLALLLDERAEALDAWESLADGSGPEPDELPDSAPDIEAEPAGAAPAVAVAADSAEDATGAGATVTRGNGGPTAPPSETTPRELARVRAQLAEWRERATTAEARLAVGREQAQTESRAGHIQLQGGKRRIAALEEQLREIKRLYDRTTRRLKSSEKEATEAVAENKRLQRQVRRQQQLNEELRKQLANATARLQPAPVPRSDGALPPGTAVAAGGSAATGQTPARHGGEPAGRLPVVAMPAGGLPWPVPRQVATASSDQMFIWQSDGRQFRVTPREVKRAVDRSDEDFVFALIQAFDALRESNEAGYRMFLDRIREFDRYYSRVLTVDTTRVLIDASNVARYENNRYGKGQLRHLLAMRDELRRRDCFPIIMYGDASLPYHIDEPNELMQMVKRGELHLVPSGQEADEQLAREARRTGAYVVTNDRSFHTKVSPDFEPPRITFRIHDGLLIVDEF